MFEDYISDNSWPNHSHRGWTALASFAAQLAAMVVLLVLPLLHIQAMPRLASLRSLVAPTSPPAPGGQRVARSQSVSSQGGHLLFRPGPIPKPIPVSGEGDASLPDLPGEPGVVGTVGDDPGSRSLWATMGSGMRPAIPVAPSVRPPRVSHVMEGNLISRVQPEYPALAKQARIQGTVVLRAVINREGKIQDLQVISGHPLLVQAAMNAVRQCRYRPYYLNDQAVEVETQVTVNFSLWGG